MNSESQSSMWTAMLETMRAAIDTGRAGKPVAARLYLECPAEAADLAQELALGADAVAQLLGSPIETFSVFGSPASRQLSSLWRLACGASALVSVAAVGQPGQAECVVFAQRGTWRWESGLDDFPLSDGGAASPGLNLGATELRRQIRAKLAADTGVEQPRSLPSPDRRRACAPPYGVLLVSGDYTHQPGYAAALAADPRCRLVAMADEKDVSDRRRQLNEQLAERLGVPYLEDLDAALARDDIHIVSVCAEPYRRGRIIVKAAGAGKHLYLDKPLCGTLAEADAIVAAVRNSGVVAHMFSQVCFDPALKARRRAMSGRLGDLMAIHSDLCFAKGHAGTATLGVPRKESIQPARFELADSKRELTNVGIYNVVLLLWLTGHRVRRVAASTGNYFFAEHQANDMEDFGQILLEFDGGVCATITAGRLGWKSHPSSGLNRTYLVGREAASTVDAHQPRVEVWTADEPWQPPARNPEDPMGMWQSPPGSPHQSRPKQDWFIPGQASWELDTDHFLDCIEQGRSSDVSVELAAAATEILLAAYRSAATGQIVELRQD